ncbi:MAG: transmembrane anchor protein [Phenylobacterium sp.]|uniref:transmembrane anchor protein n=1 Tax=Phenylobacterium sp. TaxID=1871053 RepID=UPI002720228D|nr:transmembrane anchor protein [Phenylobacterium sp.]MDO8912152.1 transmembrane anchor protein [Phenylobacterium sp.]MDO9248023.1 transmembrane anchor protein [Phenylobacterium sp.]
MHNAQKPDLADLPTASRLLRSTAIAVGVAAALLIAVVLPAEYAVDPTGIGRLLGLTEMGAVKMAIAREAEQEVSSAMASAPAITAQAPRPPAAAAVPAPVQASAPAKEAPAAKAEEMTLTLAPGQGVEIKAKMRKGASVTYVWVTDGPKLNFDTHGDGNGISYHGYGKGSESRSEGTLTAAFDGSHGWFWRNRAGKSVTVTLKVTGDFNGLKRLV